jgi:hypothetical protein
MYGKDICRILKLINQIKDESAKQIKLLADESDYRLKMIKHTHHVTVEGVTENTVCDHTGEPYCSCAGHVHDINFDLKNGSPTDPGGQTSGFITNERTWSGDYSKDDHGHGDHNRTESSVVYEHETPGSASSFTDPIVAINDNLKKDVDKLKEIASDMYKPIEEFNTEYGSPWTEIYNLDKMVDELKAYADIVKNLQWLAERQSLLHYIQRVMTFSVDAKWAITMYHDWIQRAYDFKFNGKKPSITWEDFEKGQTIGNISQGHDENVNLEAPSKDPY